MDNGNLIRYGGSFSSNALYIEMRDWDNNVLWKWYPPDEYKYIHSDLIIMPGNESFILTQETRMSHAEWGDLGGNTSGLSNDYTALEALIEVVPVGSDDANVIWQWRMLDHLIQDYDDTKPNFGVVADHPGRWDINNPNSINLPKDHVHINGIDYNPERDQIVYSCLSCSEIMIIDHSTTTAEAATESGGNSGKGGQILYRYGNPQNYDHGTAADRKLYGQHNADWINPGLLHEGKISVFDNGNTRPSGNWSRIVVLDPPIDADGNYLKDSNGAYLPKDFDFTWDGTVNGDTFFSRYMSGWNMQPNGNMTVCEATSGLFFEVNQEGEVVWIYQNPNQGNIVNQGGNANNADAYRAEKYAPDYGAFVGRELIPMGIMENTNPVSDTCQIYSNIPLPMANFEFELGMDGLPIEISFTDLSTDVTTEWLWDFGDGFTSNENYEQNPVHTFLNAQVYEVCLTATNEAGSNTFCQMIDLTILNIEEENKFNVQLQQSGEWLHISATTHFDRIELVDLNGKVVYNTTLEANQNQLIDIHYVNKGLYIAKLIFVNPKDYRNEEVHTVRFLKR